MNYSLRPLIILVLFLCSNTAFAWGPTGHRAIGHIAEKYLSKKARKKIFHLLNGNSLAEASTWMDDVRSDSTYDYMADWHWVTIPGGERYETAVKNPNGDIIAAIERIISELGQGKLSQEEQAVNIRIMVHLIGDLHQPLHVGARDDRGGNAVKVSWFGRESNLHRVWDSDIIDGTKLSYTELASFLAKPARDEVRRIQSGDARAWAAESQGYHERVYDIGNGSLGYRYAYVNLPLIEKRLLEAGIRLAGVLNSIYGK